MNSSTATVVSAWPQAGVAWARAYAPHVALVGYVAGFSVLPNEWFHLGWLLCVGTWALISTSLGSEGARWPVDRASLLISLFLGWMTLRSLAAEPFQHGQALLEAGRGLSGTALLVLLCLLLWRAGADALALRRVAQFSALCAAAAAATSIIFCYAYLPGHVPGERLQNILVHGGLNQVCTGLIFGFCGLWLLALPSSVPAVRFLAAFLHWAALLSGSRGVMLALACGHAVLLAACGWRRGRSGLAVLLGAGGLYLVTLAVFDSYPRWHSRPVLQHVAAAPAHVWTHISDRADSGRLRIYQAGWRAASQPCFGLGQWGIKPTWHDGLLPDTHGIQGHLHSVFLATYLHGGLVGLLLLGLLLREAAVRACRLARGVAPEPAWAALLAYGCAGLLFDGESLTSVATLPRFEGLLFWVPLVLTFSRSCPLPSSRSSLHHA